MYSVSKWRKVFSNSIDDSHNKRQLVDSQMIKLQSCLFGFLKKAGGKMVWRQWKGISRTLFYLQGSGRIRGWGSHHLSLEGKRKVSHHWVFSCESQVSVRIRRWKEWQYIKDKNFYNDGLWIPESTVEIGSRRRIVVYRGLNRSPQNLMKVKEGDED